jgi:NTP pyrophosphatase (non-canonical NTP hydrolase)
MEEQQNFGLNEYQTETKRTMASLSKEPLNLAIAGLGIAGEAGEVADYLKKVVGHGHELDKAKLCAELGDVLWYVSFIATLVDVPLAEIAQQNVAKLRKRYPEGFESKRSIQRESEKV